MINHDMEVSNYDGVISIVMPTYNRGYIISRAIESVLKQNYTRWELIIVDDGSTDDTEIIIDKYKNDARIRYIKYFPNKGANYARNLGMKNAYGEYIAFLDSDNLWDDNFLASHIEVFETNDVDFVFNKVEINEKGKINFEPKEEVNLVNNYDDLLKILCLKNIIDTNTVCMKKELFVKYCGFDNSLKSLQDWEYFFRLIIINKVKYKYINTVLSYNFIQKNSISKKGYFYESSALLLYKYYDFYKKHKCLDVWIKRFVLYISEPNSDSDLKNKVISKFDSLDEYKKYAEYCIESKKHILDKIVNKCVTNKIINCKIAVQIHIYYVDLVDEIIEYTNNIPEKFDCYISTDDNDKAEIIYNAFINRSKCNHLEIFTYKNKGRDVVPFLIQMQYRALKYEYLLHIHTKKTLQSKKKNWGNIWRKYLFDSLIGNKNTVENILRIFNTDKSIGMFFPDITSVNGGNNVYIWGKNRYISQKMLNSLNLKIEIENSNSEIIFPAGNMFWARTEAIYQFFDGRIDENMFPDENGQRDYTEMHAVERLWSVVCVYNGYKFVMNNEDLIETKCNRMQKEYIKENKKISIDSYHKVKKERDVLKKAIKILMN